MLALSEVNFIQASAENVFVEDGDVGENAFIEDADVGIPSSSSMATVSLKTVKKTTRQWAAWTRQEEENFFNALRQVGKNFEKITCRVQSKNRDQVRHYYYRLVRRMNKLLGPEFCLDAKNTPDTNAAMLRWWSLLEKYSCTASKLHLKPRRFKTFIEALAHQLLKDRSKTRRKHSIQGETCSSIPSSTDTVFNKSPGNDARSVKLLIANGQNTIGSTKSASLKRSISANIHSHRGDSATMKTTRQRRTVGASAAYRQWEKAAIAGVSLVADAAEQLERTSNDVNISPGQVSSDLLSYKKSMEKGNKDITFDGEEIDPLPSPSCRWICSQNQIRGKNGFPLMKLKLQLFPIDESTRKALEKDEHNPHLELTLSARKRISSILEHLNRKWGNSSIASGELMLFPYSIRQDDIASSQRWTLKDTSASAADVYATIGSPAIFRLRYGWFSNMELVSRNVQSPPMSVDIDVQAKDTRQVHADSDVSGEKAMKMDTAGRFATPLSDTPEQSMTVKTAVTLSEPMNQDNLMNPSVKHQGPQQQATASPRVREVGDGRERKENMENPRRNNSILLSASEWADSLTNISMGDLLSESSRVEESCIDPRTGDRVPSLQPIPFSCDSFDAAISAHISAHQNQPILSNRVSQPSIWDAEETCDEFSFQMNAALNREDPSSLSNVVNGPCRQNTIISSNGFYGLLKDLADSELSEDHQSESAIRANSHSDEKLLSSHYKYSPAKSLGPTDAYWPDSLGPLDLDIPSSRYQSEDLIFGDSVSFSGLSRLIANSLDAFQNCSFFQVDKKESLASESQGAFPLLDNKHGSDG